MVEFFDNLTKGFISQTVEVCIQDEDVVEARKVLAQLQVGMRESWNWWENRSNQQKTTLDSSVFTKSAQLCVCV